MTKDELVAIRDVLPEDKNFILSTFLKGLYHGESPLSEMKKQTFMEKYHAVIESLLASPNTKVCVACLKDDPGVILGYAILTGPAVAWAFVKKNWRGIGIAKDLIPPTTNTFTHYTKVGLIIARKKNLAFDPFIF